MFWRREKVSRPFFNSTVTEVKLEIEASSQLRRQVEMIGITTKELQVLRTLQPLIENEIERIVDQFYRNLEKEPTLIHIINKHSSIERLKKTLKRHITEMFSGKIDSTYIRKCQVIAHVHVKIGLGAKWYLAAFQDILSSMMNIIEQHELNREETFLAIRAVTKIINLEEQLVLDAYEEETKRMKQDIADEKDDIRLNIRSTSESLAAFSEETNAGLEELMAQSEEIVTLARRGSKLSQVAMNKALSGKEEVNTLTEKMDNISSSVEGIRGDAQELVDIMKQMQDIVNIVSAIAEQTNLLSLNASIEAARAGEAGKGFAIVAEEIRKLSDQTKESVVNVTSLIKNTNEQVEKVTSTVEQIRQNVQSGNISSHEIEDDFAEIVQTMNDTDNQNNRMENEIEVFVESIHMIGKSFEEVAVTADNLNSLTNNLD